MSGSAFVKSRENEGIHEFLIRLIKLCSDPEE